ncbi:MAG TPA: hypothetical protein DF296_10775 [Candidatus Margulisbacteria bacterium]|nr:hypothetical protein [Candidatus Margulisiibacteriota bacterium]
MVKSNKIFVVEPESVISDALRSICDNHIVTINNVDRAIDWFGAGDEQVAIVVIDRDLPDSSGIKLLSHIRLRNPFVDIIMVTQTATIDDAVLFGQLGAFDYIEKPLNIDRLRELINRLTTTFDYARKFAYWEKWGKAVSAEMDWRLTLFHEAFIQKMLGDTTAINRVDMIFPTLTTTSYITPQEIRAELEHQLGIIERPQKQPKILIIEDEDMWRESYQTILEENYNLLLAGNGLQAIEFVKQEKDIDIILLDIYLPDIKGNKLYHQIRQFNKTAEVIVVTAFQESDIAMELFREGAFDYLNKPLTEIILIEKIQKAFDFKDSLDNLPGLVKQFEDQKISYEKRIEMFDLFSRNKKAKGENISMIDTMIFFPEYELAQLPPMANYAPLTLATGLKGFIDMLINKSQNPLQQKMNNLFKIKRLYNL